MASVGPNINGSQFFLSASIDGKHVVFRSVTEGISMAHDGFDVGHSGFKDLVPGVSAVRTYVFMCLQIHFPKRA